MATYNKFLDFAEQIGLEQHNINTDTLNIALTNTLPVNTQTVFAPGTDHPPPAAANGYAVADTTNTWSEAAGTATAAAVDVVFTAAGGQIGPFRYVVLYNDTNGTDMLVAWWDYGSSITLNDTETFTTDFAADTLFTLA